MLSNYEKIKQKISDELQSWMKPNLVYIILLIELFS